MFRSIESSSSKTITASCLVFRFRSRRFPDGDWPLTVVKSSSSFRFFFLVRAPRNTSPTFPFPKLTGTYILHISPFISNQKTSGEHTRERERERERDTHTHRLPLSNQWVPIVLNTEENGAIIICCCCRCCCCSCRCCWYFSSDPKRRGSSPRRPVVHH